jgi:hypothetical protein
MYLHLLDDLDLPVEPGSATFYQWDIGRQTHPVDMSPRIKVIQRIENNVECFEPRDIEPSMLDILVVGFDLDIGIELASRRFRNLSMISACPVTPSF